MSNVITRPENLKLVYTLFCDDVRLEAGNKLSYMGVFQNIMVQKLPITLIKFAIVNHWAGEGNHLSEVRILAPDRMRALVASEPTNFGVAPGGFADNISVFVNVEFPVSGQYWVQTLIDSNLYDERPLTISEATEPQMLGASEAVN